MYGFLEERLEEVERGQGYEVMIGYIKRPEAVNNFFRGNIVVSDGGTAGTVVSYPINISMILFNCKLMISATGLA